MKSNPDIHTFVTLRVTGDNLHPAEITNIISIAPTRAYGKGASYYAGPHAGTRIGRTGVWYVSTDKMVNSTVLSDHVKFLVNEISGVQTSNALPNSKISGSAVQKLLVRLAKLESLIKRRKLRAVITLFWHGAAGAKLPAIPELVRSISKLVDIEVETDFDTDEPRVA